jgi:hypothetical protein
MPRLFTHKSTSATRGDGYRKARSRSLRKWGGYEAPGNTPGTVFGGAHITNQTLRPAAWLPIRELLNQTDLHVRQYPIALYAGTIVALWEDAQETLDGGSGGLSGISRAALVPANGGQWATTEDAYSTWDTEFAVRAKASASVVNSTAREDVEPNRPCGALMFDAYQNMSNVYKNFDPQESGVTVLLHGYARYAYSARNKVLSDAAWAVKVDATDTDTAAATTALKAITVADTDKTWTFVGVGKIIKDGPLARDLQIFHGTADVNTEVTHLIDWAATRAAGPNVIKLKSDPGDCTQARIVCYATRSAIVTAIDLTNNIITVDNASHLGIAVADDDVLVDQDGTLYTAHATQATAGAIKVETDLDGTQTVAVGGRLSVFTDNSDSDSVWCKRSPDEEIKNGDYFMAGPWGQVTKFSPEVDPEDQKLGRVFYVEPAGQHARNFAENVEVVSGFDLTGDDTGGLAEFLYDEFGNSPSTARAMWVNFGVK